MRAKMTMKLATNELESKVVPIEYFLEHISSATGWKASDFPKIKDIGDVESALNVKAEKPIQTKSTKRGKSKNELYRHVSEKERHDARTAMDSIISVYYS